MTNEEGDEIMGRNRSGDKELCEIGYKLVKSCISKKDNAIKQNHFKSCIKKKALGKGPDYLKKVLIKAPNRKRDLVGESLSYVDAIMLYLDMAIVKKDRHACEVFKMFQDDIDKQNRGREYVTHFAMKLKGLVDLVEIDLFYPDSYKSGLISQISEHSEYDTPLLIIGETGTSKQMVAEVIHEVSNRRNGHFMEINCAAIPSDLLESELFGYEKGSHNKADKTKKGLFEEADEGTIF
jgi:hypothetical protein